MKDDGTEHTQTLLSSTILTGLDLLTVAAGNVRLANRSEFDLTQHIRRIRKDRKKAKK